MTKSRKLFLIILPAAVILYALIIWQGHAGVTRLHEGKAFDVLNALTKSQGEQPLNFYVWRLEEILFGPAKMVISGLIFTAFALLYLQKASILLYFLWVFAYLVVTRPEVLLYPPYGDAIGGPFAEAIWLFKNNFDYIGLSKQAIFIHGGPKVYLFSIYPAFIAVMLKLFRDPEVFLIINHLVVFSWGALLIAYFREILLKICSPKIALLMSMGILAMPLFQAQVEAINMEIPMVLFSILAVYQLTKKNIALAAIFSVVAAMVKGVAILICGTVTLIAVFLFFFGEKGERFNWRYVFWGVITLGFITGKWLLASHYLSCEGEVPWVGMFQGWPSIKSFKFAYLFLGSLFVFLFVFVKKRFFAEGAGTNFITFLKNNYVTFIMFVAATAWYVLFLQTFAVSPRYWLLLVPFNSFCIFYACQVLIKNEKVLAGALVIFITLGFINSYGLFYPPFDDNDHVILERSLEYRNDQLVNIDLVKEIEGNFSHFKVVSPFIQAQMLAIPEIGYVKKPLNVYIYGWSCTYENIKDYPGIKEIGILEAIYLGVKFKTLKLGDIDDYPVSNKDKIVKEIQYGDKKGWIFMGGFAIDAVLRAKRMMMLEQMRNKFPK
ncbi:MAG: hypothetical protein KAR05_09235 [Candidatus Omnitrophica bacterium]|nr:hypothetical protein [Candidatus Omnitrophota bacterium]